MKTTNQFRAKFSLITELFHKQNEFKTEFESMQVNEMNKLSLYKVLRFS